MLSFVHAFFSTNIQKNCSFQRQKQPNFYSYTIFGLQNNTVEQNRFSNTILPGVLDTNKNTLRKTLSFPITWNSLLFSPLKKNWSIVDLQCQAYSKVIQLYYTYMCVYMLFQILFHYRLLQGIEYSSLCCTVSPCCLSILYIVMCIC